MKSVNRAISSLLVGLSVDSWHFQPNRPTKLDGADAAGRNRDRIAQNRRTPPTPSTAGLCTLVSMVASGIASIKPSPTGDVLICEISLICAGEICLQNNFLSEYPII
jgi:hypothetical protein